jgi:hypothetical protein
MKRSSELYIRDILDYMERAEKHIKGLTLGEFLRVLNAMTTPNMLTAKGLVAYSPITTVGNEMNDWNMRKTEFNHTIP